MVHDEELWHGFRETPLLAIGCVSISPSYSVGNCRNVVRDYESVLALDPLSLKGDIGVIFRKQNKTKPFNTSLNVYLR